MRTLERGLHGSNHRDNDHSWTSLCVFVQKSPRVRKIFVRNSGAGNGCANFMDAWKKCVLSAGKPMSIKFRVLGGGVGGGGGCRFYFYGCEDFSDLLFSQSSTCCLEKRLRLRTRREARLPESARNLACSCDTALYCDTIYDLYSAMLRCDPPPPNGCDRALFETL